MTDREQYAPGPASGAQVRRDRGQNGEDKWTLILVRELRHSPEKVWQALTDPAHLREWAPFAGAPMRAGARRPRRGPRPGWSRGKAPHGGSARAARSRNKSDASRRS